MRIIVFKQSYHFWPRDGTIPNTWETWLGVCSPESKPGPDERPASIGCLPRDKSHPDSISNFLWPLHFWEQVSTPARMETCIRTIIPLERILFWAVVAHWRRGISYLQLFVAAPVGATNFCLVSYSGSIQNKTGWAQAWFERNALFTWFSEIYYTML